MLGPLTRKIISKGFGWGAAFGSAPYSWDSKTGLPVVVKSKRRRFFWWLNIALIILFVLILLFRLKGIRSNTMNSKDDTDSTWMEPFLTFWTAYWTFALCVQVTIVQAEEEIPEFVKLYFEYYQSENYQRHHAKKPVQNGISAFKKHKISGIAASDLFMFSLYYMCIGCYIVFLVPCFVYPELPLGFLDVKPIQGHYEHFTTRRTLRIGLNALFLIYLEGSYLGNLVLNGFVEMAYAFEMLESLQELTRREEAVGNEDLIRPKRTIQQPWVSSINHFQILHLLQQRYKSIYSPVLLPSNQWIFSFITSYCIYGAVRGSGMIQILFVSAAVALILFLSVFYSLLGELYECSSNLLTLWKRRSRGTKYIKRRLRALQPLKFSMGSYYYADRGMVLTMCQTILESTADILVANKQ